MIVSVRRLQLKVRLASVSRTGGLTKPDFRIAVQRFLRWRRLHSKPKKRRVKRIWVR
jgi:hypothetical protein